jgi:hypothetical protein
MKGPTRALLVPLLALLAPGMARAADTLDKILAIDPAASSPAADLLAAKMPAEQRAQSHRMFTMLLDAYRQIETSAGVKTDEPAGAIAVFVAGNVAVHRGREISDPELTALVAQVRRVTAADAGLVKSLRLDRANVAQQYALVGMFMAVGQKSLAETPDAAQQAMLRQAAQGYLHTYLQTDIDSVEIGEHGLSWRNGKPSGALAAIGADARVAETSAATPAPGATAPATVKSGAGEQDLHALEERVKGIETIGFYTRTEMGVGGYFNFVPAPMVLFKSGDALRDMKQLADPAGLEANKSAHPSAWTKWRRNGGVLESLESNNTWKKLPYPKTYDRLAKGFKLSGKYKRLSGTGNVAFGGGSSVTAWSELVFDRSGTFRTSDGGSVSSVDDRSSAFATGTRPEGSGTYEIEGYVLTLRYAGGHTVYRMITADASDPKAIWLDGFGYTQ